MQWCYSCGCTPPHRHVPLTIASSWWTVTWKAPLRYGIWCAETYGVKYLEGNNFECAQQEAGHILQRFRYKFKADGFPFCKAVVRKDATCFNITITAFCRNSYISCALVHISIYSINRSIYITQMQYYCEVQNEHTCIYVELEADYILTHVYVCGTGGWLYTNTRVYMWNWRPIIYKHTCIYVELEAYLYGATRVFVSNILGLLTKAHNNLLCTGLLHRHTTSYPTLCHRKHKAWQYDHLYRSTQVHLNHLKYSKLVPVSCLFPQGPNYKKKITIPHLPQLKIIHININMPHH